MIFYKGLQVFESLDVDSKDLFKADSDGWRQFYQDLKGIVIKFYPFSEYHGGGQPYFIQIGKVDLDNWLNQNPDFENKIREIIVKSNS